MTALIIALAIAGQSPDTPAAAAPADGPKAISEKKICRSEVPIGSIMPRRTCKTKAEWDAIKAQQQQDAERFGRDRDNGSLRPPGS